jgi:hypothetical protein
MSRTNLQKQSEAYAEQGYVKIDSLFPVAVMEALYDRLFTDLDLSRPAAPFVVQGPLLSKTAIEVYSHQYSPLATFLWGLTSRAAEVAQRDLLPTYSYFRIYQQGDICRVHSDRHACEHSLSLTVALSDHKPWALSVERARMDSPTPKVDADFGGQEFSSLPMSVGDAVMYQGVHHRHARLDPNPNRWSAHLFLHWVDAKGAYVDHAFDRPALEAAQRAVR